MSVFEQIFFDPNADSVEAGGSLIADALGLAFRVSAPDTVALWSEDDPELVAPVSGEVIANIFSEKYPEKPEDLAVFDPLPMVFRLRVAPSMYQHQQGVALVLFRRLVARVAWRCVLTHEYEDLVATFDPARGVRTFPSGTRSDGTHVHLWG